MASRARDLYAVILLAVLANSLLWLDSLDRYLNGRYHFYLSQYVAEEAFLPSRVMREAMSAEERPAVPISIIPLAHATRMVPPDALGPVTPESMVQASAQASGVQVSGVQAASEVQASGVQAAAVAASDVPATASLAESAPQATAPTEVAATPAAFRQPAPEVADAVPRVLFAGDSMMQGVAPVVISRLRKEHPKGVFVDLSKPSTGLVARRYFDWPEKIREESIRHGIQVIVMFLGPNDPWDIYEGKRRYAFPSDAWEEKYRGRVDEVLEFAKTNGIRVVWIGLPAMREERVKQGAMIENRIFQEEVRKYEFEFLPTEDLIGSLDAPYSKYIEDPKKGKQAVRLDDGVHFTMLGLRMIGSRVSQSLGEDR